MPVAPPAALLDLLEVLRCPGCGEDLEPAGPVLRCPRGHSFDVARGGYVSLLGGGGAISGDDDQMARARERFLGTGAYAPLREALGDLAQRAVPALTDPPDAPAPAPATVLDVGCGPGYYLAGLLERFPTARGLGLDTSARSLRFTARAHRRAAAVRGDVFAALPLEDASVDLLLDVFAPRHPAEFARVLHPRGALLVARPDPEHLQELRAAVPGMVAVDPRKEERLEAALAPSFTVIGEQLLRRPLALDAGQARDLVAMTPSARHVGPGGLAALPAEDADGQALTVTVAVRISALRRR